MEVRLFDRKTDLRILRESEESAHEASFPGVALPFETVGERLAAISSGECVAFTLVDDIPVGCAIASVQLFYAVPIGYIESIYIAPTHRGAGGLSALLDAVCDHFKDADVRFLQLDVSPGNERAITAYEKYGFSVTRLQMEKQIVT